jgi:hypothetical protein
VVPELELGTKTSLYIFWRLLTCSCSHNHFYMISRSQPQHTLPPVFNSQGHVISVINIADMSPCEIIAGRGTAVCKVKYQVRDYLFCFGCWRWNEATGLLATKPYHRSDTEPRCRKNVDHAAGEGHLRSVLNLTCHRTYFWTRI